MSIPYVETIVEIVKRVGELEDIGPEQDIYSAGVNSMRGMDIMLDMESTFDVAIPDDQFLSARTPTALAALVERLKAQ